MLFRYPPLRDLLRRSVAARAELCSREQCASERSCPFGRRRAALAQAQLVVANHDLLLRWPPDYPNFTFAIVDEAHELTGVADEVFAAEVRPAEVLERLDELFGRPADGSQAETLIPKARLRGSARDARAWRRGVQQDFVSLGRSLADRADEVGGVQLPLYADRIFPEATALAAQAAQRVTGTRKVAQTANRPDPADSIYVPASRAPDATQIFSPGALGDFGPPFRETSFAFAMPRSGEFMKGPAISSRSQSRRNSWASESVSRVRELCG
jgi:Rad3-related DNA helicase